MGWVLLHSECIMPANDLPREINLTFHDNPELIKDIENAFLKWQNQIREAKPADKPKTPVEFQDYPFTYNMWQRESSGSRRSDEGILAYCNRLRREGHPMFIYTDKRDKHPITYEQLYTE